MKLIVGLGNPGLAYAKTRHNVGFQCLDFIAAEHNITFDKKSMKAHWGKGTIAGQEVLLAKPQTYMNLSGQSVGEIVRFFKLNPAQDLLVIYDELDLPLGKIRLRPNGSSGGQNGVKNIIELLGTQNVQRIRVGIGRPAQGTAKDRVLNAFSPEEQKVMDQIYPRVEEAVRIWLTEGIEKAMNRYNAV
ncbi:MAG TPA: aminoacyl-tRNA hydrolase [Chloroflexia bacterium]|nr:aminoacyl-tRNA hydrolase [Chloroflexia bacterium]